MDKLYLGLYFRWRASFWLASKQTHHNHCKSWVSLQESHVFYKCWISTPGTAHVVSRGSDVFERFSAYSSVFSFYVRFVYSPARTRLWINIACANNPGSITWCTVRQKRNCSEILKTSGNSTCCFSFGKRETASGIPHVGCLWKNGTTFFWVKYFCECWEETMMKICFSYTVHPI